MSLIKALHGDKPLLMAILNITPDSFSDGGRLQNFDQLKRHLDACASHGVDILDIGGESTRPGAVAVPLEDELGRVLPVIELAKNHTDCYLSLDTYKPEVMQHALDLNVDMINDVNALQAPKALDVLVSFPSAAVCLMHKQGDIGSMQHAPRYTDVVNEVFGFLRDRVNICQQKGIALERIVIDPGFGFGKTIEHNVNLFKGLNRFQALGQPLLVGVSRKSMLGRLLDDLAVEQRTVPSVIAAVLALAEGAKIIRVHDVVETSQAIKLVMALTNWFEEK